MIKFAVSAGLTAWAILGTVAGITVHLTDKRPVSNSQACLVARQAFLDGPIEETSRYNPISKQLIEVCK